MSSPFLTIITSFRSFLEGSENTRIQRRFLDSISEIGKTKCVEIIAVQWSEVGVENELTRTKIPHQVIRLGNAIPYFRYSLSEVLEYAIPISKGSIIIYTTCDVEFQRGFLEKIQGFMRNVDLVIPFPYMEMEIEQTTQEPRVIQRVSSSGLDVFVFSGDSLKKLHLKGFFRSYRFLGWGMFDHFLVLVSLKQKLKIVRLSMEKEITKHVNDRNQNAETKEWLRITHRQNTGIVRQFIKINFKYLPLLRLEGIYLAIDGNKLGFKQIIDFGGLYLIRSQLKFLVLKLIQRLRRSSPKE